MRLVTTCVDAPTYCGSMRAAIDALEAFDDKAREISIKHAIRAIGAKTLAATAPFDRYAWGHEQGLRLVKDHHVRAYRGRFEGKSTICIMWSAIHHLFQAETET